MSFIVYNDRSASRRGEQYRRSRLSFLMSMCTTMTTISNNNNESKNEANIFHYCNIPPPFIVVKGKQLRLRISSSDNLAQGEDEKEFAYHRLKQNFLWDEDVSSVYKRKNIFWHKNKIKNIFADEDVSSSSSSVSSSSDEDEPDMSLTYSERMSYRPVKNKRRLTESAQKQSVPPHMSTRAGLEIMPFFCGMGEWGDNIDDQAISIATQTDWGPQRLIRLVQVSIYYMYPLYGY